MEEDHRRDDDEVATNLPKLRAQPKGPRLPLKQLDARGRALLEAMVHGVDEREAEEHGLDPHRPLPLELAARVAGLKIKNARFVFSQVIFLREFNKELAAMRNGHKARAVQVLADIMEDPGNNLAADKAVRVKASTVLLGADASETKPNIQVGVGVQMGGDIPLRAGVVVRLKSQAVAEKHEAYIASLKDKTIDL